jgi:hypothetical protein
VTFLRHALVAALLLAGGASAEAGQPVEAAGKSLQEATDGFIAYLKSETQYAAAAAAKFARENKHHSEGMEARFTEHLAAWHAALSDQKERLGTLAEDASALWEDWWETGASTWAEVERHAIDALDWVLGWARTQSQSDQHPETPV